MWILMAKKNFVRLRDDLKVYRFEISRTSDLSLMMKKLEEIYVKVERKLGYKSLNLKKNSRSLIEQILRKCLKRN